jgi:hypothetical protein
MEADGIAGHGDLLLMQRTALYADDERPRAESTITAAGEGRKCPRYHRIDAWTAVTAGTPAARSGVAQCNAAGAQKNQSLTCSTRAPSAASGRVEVNSRANAR